MGLITKGLCPRCMVYVCCIDENGTKRLVEHDDLHVPHVCGVRHAPQQAPVYLNLYQRTDKSIYYEVKVRSVVQPQRLLVGIIEFPCAAGKVGVLAGALAEGLCELIPGERIEPSAVVRAVEELHAELRRENPHVFGGNAAPRDTDKARAAAYVARRG